MEAKYLSWFTSRDTGTSSETLICLLLDVPHLGRKDVPGDLSDFGRCYRMIEKFPELKKEFPRAAESNLEWRPFIDCWEQLSKLCNECVKWEALPEEEQKKMKKRKFFIVPNDEAWKVIQTLNACSRYMVGMRPQGSLNSWRRENVSSHLISQYLPKTATSPVPQF